MIAALEPLPDDLSALKALIVSERLEWAKAAAEKTPNSPASKMPMPDCGIFCANCGARNFGRKSEKLDPDQLNLAMEDVEQAIGESCPIEEPSEATL